VRFIEYMDVGNQNRWDISQVVPSREIISLIDTQFPLQPMQGAQGADTAEVYRFKDGEGEVGFISSVTKAFCSSCNRLRLSADGKIYTCLFATAGTDLGAYLRNGADDGFLTDFIREIWGKRQDHYSEIRSQLRHKSYPLPKIEMYQIGG
jgi:cyclic pyranopterin phosphate synthase